MLIMSSEQRQSLMRPCRVCGKMFYRGPRDVCCSAECSLVRVNTPRQCERCGVEFRLNKRGRPKLYCSKECHANRKNKDQEHNCKVCGGKMPPEYPNRKTCSIVCKRRHNANRMHQYKQGHLEKFREYRRKSMSNPENRQKEKEACRRWHADKRKEKQMASLTALIQDLRDIIKKGE